MKKTLFWKNMVAVMTSALLAVLVGCSNQTSDNIKKSVKSSNVGENQQKAEKKRSGDTFASQDTKKVGTPEYGYVKVPTDWIRFKDVDGNSSYQVCKGPSEIISLNLMKGDPKATLENYSRSLAYNIQNKGGKDVKTKHVKLKDFDAFQVYSTFYNGSYVIVAWVFKTDDGKVHYIAAEGQKEKASEAVGYIENGGWTAK